MNSISQRLDTISLPTKCVLFLLPLLIAFASLVYNSYKSTSGQIEVAEHETQGSQVLTELYKMQALLWAWVESPQSANASALQSELKSIAKRMPEDWKESRKAISELSAVLDKAKPTSSDEASKLYLSAVRQIADDSELTLDPVMPTYYLMSPMAFLIPPMVEELNQLKLELKAVKDDAEAGALLRAGVLSISGKFAEVREALMKSGKAGANLKPDLTRLTEKINTLNSDAYNLFKPGTNIDSGKVQSGKEWISQSNAALSELQGSVNANLQTELQKRIQSVEMDLWMSWITPLSSMCLALGLAYWVFRNLNACISELIDHTEALAQGDLSTPVKRQGGSELHRLQSAVEHIRVGQSGVIHKLKLTGDTMTNTIEQLAHVSSLVQENVTQQNDSTSAVAASIEELTVSIEQVHSHANVANNLANQAGQLSAEGQHSVQQARGAMDNIEQASTLLGKNIHTLGIQSSNISSIVEAIHGIASQTNLLALNAAIEAARAGEQGRGFAVVADEVRKLAEKTSESTGSIADLVHTIQSEVEQAVSQVQGWTQMIREGKASSVQADQHMQNISESARSTEGAVHEITSALHEQASASTLIAQKVEQIASMSEEGQQAAKQVQEVIGSLTGLSAQVKQLTGQFKLQVGRHTVE